jgi:DNA-binding beta-propeller fold protein YncE
MRPWLALALIAAAAGCAAPAPTPESDARPQDVLFYPPAPDEPRLQYLTKFSSALDVSARSAGMREFVFGGQQFEEQLVNKPYGVAMYEGSVFVVDTRGGGYGVFDLAAGNSRMVRGSGPGAMPKPINITIDADGTRYVTDTEREAVLVFDRDDRYQRTLGKPDQFQPVDVAIAGDRLYVSDVEHHKVDVLDKRTGETLLTIGEPGSEPGQLFHPTNLAIGPDDTLYVSETSNFRISHFTLEGEFIRTIGNIGTQPGQFARPKGIALDREGRIYVVDAAFGNVQLLDADGTPLTFFGEPGAGGPGGIYLPTAVKVDYDNVEYFRKYAAPGFEVEYLVLVASQFGQNKVAVFGFGSATGDLGGAGEGGR